MPGLFDSMTLREVTFRNRLWVSPMCQYSCEEQDGMVHEWHLVHLGSFATGGAGLILTEATAVVPEGRISPQDAGIWSDAQRDAWSRIVGFVHAQGATIGMQLAHAGRKGSTRRPWEGRGSVPEAEGGWATVAPSAIAYGDYAMPRALERDELPALVAAFRAATRRALEAGFDLIEVHAAHGYLLHEFLSPLSNRRDDEYGGSLGNRARLLLEVVRAVRAEAGAGVPVLIRFSGSDWVEGGWDIEQTATVAAWAREAGADLFDLSSGGLHQDQKVIEGPGYQVPFAERVHAEGLPVAAVGLITSPVQAARIVESGKADAVLLAREFLRAPHFPLHAARELGIELDYWPVQYLRAR